MHHASFILISIWYEWYIIFMHILLTKWCKNRKLDRLFIWYISNWFISVDCCVWQAAQNWWLIPRLCKCELFNTRHIEFHTFQVTCYAFTDVKSMYEERWNFLLMTLTNYVFDILTKFHWYYINLIDVLLSRICNSNFYFIIYIHVILKT